jgi:hypothetical protein
MHPRFSAYISGITMSAYIGDLQRSMHPERREPPRWRLAWLRHSR